MKTIFRKVTNLRGWAYGLFWSWNIIFLAFMLFGFAPQVLPDMLIAARVGEIPTAFLVYALLLTIIPAVAVIIGLVLLRRSPGRLFALGYGVEGPLMLVLAIRFFAVRQMTPAVALLLATALLGTATYLWQILDRNIDRRGPLLTYARVAGLTLLLITGLYASVWLAFYAIPLGTQGVVLIGEALRHLPEFIGDAWDALLAFNWRDLLEIPWAWVPFWVLGMILFGYSATLFVLMPIAVLVLYTRAWWQGVKVMIQQYGRLPAYGLSGALLVLFMVAFVITNRQPQHQAFALLKNAPTSLTEAQALLAQQETIRAGLLNAYLAPQRYFSAVGEVRHIKEMYQWGLDMSPEGAERVQQLYETVARPVLYKPVNLSKKDDNFALRSEPLEAAELYVNFFDKPIIDGERETIINAARSTWSLEQAEADWQAVDDREIYLTHQEIAISERGDWAEVELYEVYQNQTTQRQEVVYYFSLPESAVITGVWLGNSPNRAERFDYRISPRGAAQAMYRSEVRRNVDPALVEQIGPRQYRLRIFPVEPQSWRRDETTDRSVINDAPPLYMWLTWQVLAQEAVWPMPRLAEKRNVYWDDTTTRLVNGQPMPAAAESWLPAVVAATSSAPAVGHRVDFSGGESVLIQPVSNGDLPLLPNNLRLALVLDRSRSMADYAAEVEASVAHLTELAEAGATVDVYLTASVYRGEEPARTDLTGLDAVNIIYYGGQNAGDLLAQFDELYTGESYDAILVLTDGSGYELGPNEAEFSISGAPVWTVHLNGDFPLGYDDATLETIQASGGGVAGSIDEALTRLAVALDDDFAVAVNVDIVDGYSWTTLPTQQLESQDDHPFVTHTAGDGFAAFAARRLILAEMVRQRESLNQVSTLDRLHAVALEHGIVTPYSSMIVLVNEGQQKRLDQLEDETDRFAREYEAVGETSPITVTGVPEPEEWLLLALVTGMLFWYIYTTRLRSHKAVS